MTQQQIKQLKEWAHKAEAAHGTRELLPILDVLYAMIDALPDNTDDK